MTIGLCASCTGPLDDDALQFALTVGPGQRGGSSWSIAETRLDRLNVCGKCLASPSGAVLMKAIQDPFAYAVRPRPKRCEVHCLNPAPKGWGLLVRDRLADTTCPHCFGGADLIALPGVMVRRRTWRMRLTGKVYRRNPSPEPAPELPAPDPEWSENDTEEDDS